MPAEGVSGHSAARSLPVLPQDSISGPKSLGKKFTAVPQPTDNQGKEILLGIADCGRPLSEGSFRQQDQQWGFRKDQLGEESDHIAHLRRRSLGSPVGFPTAFKSADIVE